MGKIVPGGSVSATITTSPTSSKECSVNLTANTAVRDGGLPAGINISFKPPLGVPPFSSVMNVSASPELALGAYPFLVIATGGDMKQLVTYTLIVCSKTAAKKSASKDVEKQARE